MPRANSFIDDDPSTFPLHVRLAFDTDMEWRDAGACRGNDGQLRQAWTILAKEELVMGDSIYSGAELIAVALEYCRACPAQYDCARFALDTAPAAAYIWGTWGTDMTSLRWLKKRGDAGRQVIEDAESAGVPIQVATRDARRAGRRARQTVAA